MVGDQLAIAYNLYFQAWIHRERGEWGQAARLVARSLAQFHHAGDHDGLAETSTHAVLILEAVGDDNAAATLHGDAYVVISVVRDSGDEFVIHAMAMRPSYRRLLPGGS
jgi:hypothetical protein